MNTNTEECVLITRANRGIGLGLVSEFLKQRYQVIATCRNPNEADLLQNLKSQYTSQLQTEKLDVTDSNDFAVLSKKNCSSKNRQPDQ